MLESKEALRNFVENNYYPDFLNFNFICECGNERGNLHYEPNDDKWYFRTGSISNSYEVNTDFVEDTLWGLRQLIVKYLKL